MRQALIVGDLVPGQLVSIRTLAEKFGTSLIPVKGCSQPEDRPKVEAEAARYRLALAKITAAPKIETCDEWFKRLHRLPERVRPHRRR